MEIFRWNNLKFSLFGSAARNPPPCKNCKIAKKKSFERAFSAFSAFNIFPRKLLYADIAQATQNQ